MKNELNSALRCTGKGFLLPFSNTCHLWLLASSLIVAGLSFTSCQKQAVDNASADVALAAKAQQQKGNGMINSDAELMNMYSGLSKQTTWELQQARAATAKYRFDTVKAHADGYTNIMVDVESMGHHFMKMALVDGNFDVRKPEILVYNGLDEGHPVLVAVEYATNYFDQDGNITPRPEGFTGAGDVWKTKDETGFPFWLVHAWVWKYNPDGVFSWTNPTVDLD
jgi:hypothetical protein